MKPAQQTNEVEITVQRVYHPSRVDLEEGIPSKLTFVRREQGACSRELVIPALGIRRELPRDVPVTIELPPLAAGGYAFTCGMNMMKGTIAVLGE